MKFSVKDSQDYLLKPEEAAKRLNVSPHTLRDWLRAGKFPGIKVGNMWRVKQSDLPTRGLNGEVVKAILEVYGIEETKSASITAQLMDMQGRRDNGKGD